MIEPRKPRRPIAITTRIDPVVHRKLLRIAAQEEVSVADYLRRLVLRDVKGVPADLDKAKEFYKNIILDYITGLNKIHRKIQRRGHRGRR